MIAPSPAADCRVGRSSSLRSSVVASGNEATIAIPVQGLVRHCAFSDANLSARAIPRAFILGM